MDPPKPNENIQKALREEVRQIVSTAEIQSHHSLGLIGYMGIAMFIERHLPDGTIEKTHSERKLHWRLYIRCECVLTGVTETTEFMRQEYRKIGLEEVFDVIEAKARQLLHYSQEEMAAHTQMVRDGVKNAAVAPGWPHEDP